jgi:type VI secretion system protein ImpB
MSDGAQQEIKKNRPPRVHITHEVATGSLRRQQELPLVIGALGDFGGNAGVEKDPGEWTFVDVTAGTLDRVIERMGPALDYQVENRLSSDPNATIRVRLRMRSMADFEPAAVAEMVPELRALLEERAALEELLRLGETNSKVLRVLDEMARNTETPGGDHV